MDDAIEITLAWVIWAPLNLIVSQLSSKITAILYVNVIAITLTKGINVPFGFPVVPDV